MQGGIRCQKKGFAAPCGLFSGGHNGWNNDDYKQDDNADDQTHSHLHVLPPHLFPHTVGAPAKSLCRRGKTICLVLQGIEIFSTLRDLVDIFAHYTDGVIDLRLQRGRPLIATVCSISIGTGTR